MKKLLFWAVFFSFFEQVNAQKLAVYTLDSDILLGRSEVNCIFIDNKKNIWIGTPKGLIKFDSYKSNWVKHPLLEAASINFLAQNAQGEILAATSAGLWRVNSSGKPEKIISDTLDRIYIDQENVYLLSKSKGISRLQDDKLIKILSVPEIRYNDLHFKNDTILITTSKGVYSLANGLPRLIHREEGLRFQGKEDNFYLLKKNGIGILQADSVRELVSWDNFKAKDMVMDGSGTFWITTDRNQLINFDNLNIKEYTKQNGLSLDKINSITIDNEGIVWLVGSPGIISINITLPFFNYDLETGLSTRVVSGVAKVKDQVAVYSVDSREIVFFDKNRAVSKLNSPAKGGIIFVFSGLETLFLVDKSQTLWNYSKGSWKSIIQFKSPVSCAFDNKGEAYILLENGQLYKASINTISLLGNYPVSESVIKAKFHNGSLLALDRSGEIAFFNSNGEKNAIKLPSPIHRINDFFISQSDTIYLATDKGIAIYSSNISDTVKWIGKIDGLIDLNLKMIFKDQADQLWLQTDFGLSKVVFDENSTELLINSVTHYNEEDGLPGKYFSKVVEDSVSGIWWSSSTGITLFDPLNDLPNLQKPGVRVKSVNLLIGNTIDSLSNNYNFANYRDTILLKNNHLVEIKVNAATYNRPQSAQVLYKIRPSDDWTVISVNQSIILKDLPVGVLNIQIKTRNSFGIDSNEVVFIPIEVLGPIWQQKWVYAVAISLLFVFGFLIRRTINTVRDSKSKDLQVKLAKELEEVERKSHQQILKTEKLKQLNELIRAQKEEMESKNKEIEGQKYELALTNNQIKKQKDLILETGNKLKSSINYAQRIQGALMTTEIEIKESIDESFVMFRPRDIVSGDFYWFKKVIDKADGRELLIIAAVDCTGHGVPGAIMSVVGMNLLNSVIGIKGILEPGDILTEMNIDIRSLLRHDSTNVNDGMDMSLCVIDAKNRRVRYAGAKNPIFHIENNEVQIVKADKNPIGGQQAEERRLYTTIDIPLSDTPKMFYMFSDGYQDQFGGEKGYKFLSKNFREMLLGLSNKHILDQKTILEETFTKWKGDLHQTDDVLVIGFRV